MNRGDFQKLIGAESKEADYLPVACLLKDGHACAGYYNSNLNRDLTDSVVLLNARLVEMHDGGQRPHGKAALDDFNEFLLEIVQRYYANPEDNPLEARADEYGYSIPLAAVPLDQVAVLYPVAHISTMLRLAQEQGQPGSRVPTFFDMDKSLVLRVLRTKLW